MKTKNENLNRIIRFRAWAKGIRRMIQVDAIDFSGGTIRKGEPCLVEDKQDGGCFLLNNCVLMQFTGSIDQNGKEIYDGNVCKNGDWEPDAHAYNYRIEEVKWDNDNACWQGMNPNEDGMTCEVIGNIYEDPDLLK